VRPDSLAAVWSYNGGMTSTIAAEPISQRARRVTRRSLTALVAGAVLTAGAAVGVSAAVGSSGSPVVHASHHAAVDTGCLVRRGPC
jgi:hypothetical protein